MKSLGTHIGLLILYCLCISAFAQTGGDAQQLPSLPIPDSVIVRNQPLKDALRVLLQGKART